MAAAVALVACACALAPQAKAAALDYVSVGAMYMAYFDLDTGNDRIRWTNAGDYVFDGPQILRPLSVSSPGDYYTGGVAAAGLLNPREHGGQEAAFSRLFGFSLTGALRSYLNTNGYAFAIRLDSVTFAGTQTIAENTGVFYYNRGNDDWGGYNDAKEEWSQLSDANYLIWNGQSFSNMIHPLVASTDGFPAQYTLTYTVSIVQDVTGADVNATVVDAVTAVGGIDPFTFSYTAESLGVPPVPEPAAYAFLLAAATLVLIAARRRSANREPMAAAFCARN